MVSEARPYPLRKIHSTNDWWRHDGETNFEAKSQYRIADGAVSILLQVNCFSNEWTLGIQRGITQYKPVQYAKNCGMDFGSIVEVYAGDLNGDGFVDVVMMECNGAACGLGAMRTDNLLLLSDGSGGFRLWSFETYGLCTNDFAALGPDQPCSVMLTQMVQEDVSKSTHHSYWVCAPYAIKGATLTAIDNDTWPMWIWYKIKPNHESTTHFTTARKKVMWQNYLAKREDWCSGKLICEIPLFSVNH